MNSSKPYLEVHSGKVSAQASSNIALIKYWGKYEHQIPANPSLSYTLTHSYSVMDIAFDTTGNFGLEFTFEGKPNEAFQLKIEKYLKSIREYLPFINYTQFNIDSRNTFPHSSGIASSASSYAALALALMKIDMQINHQPIMNMQKASFLARLGSGSACRSIYNGLVEWGETQEIKGSNNEYAIPYPYEVPETFLNMNDYIALIHTGEKDVSSTQGHALMENHPFAEMRFKQANENLIKIKKAFSDNDIFAFGEVVENEALSLHAMMMTSNPSFILMDANTVKVIKEVRNFRKKQQQPLFFTLDAGANVHLLFPKSENGEILDFINNSIRPLCVNEEIIKDEVKK